MFKYVLIYCPRNNQANDLTPCGNKNPIAGEGNSIKSSSGEAGKKRFLFYRCPACLKDYNRQYISILTTAQLVAKDNTQATIDVRVSTRNTPQNREIPTDRNLPRLAPKPPTSSGSPQFSGQQPHDQPPLSPFDRHPHEQPTDLSSFRLPLDWTSLEQPPHGQQPFWPFDGQQSYVQQSPWQQSGGQSYVQQSYVQQYYVSQFSGQSSSYVQQSYVPPQPYGQQPLPPFDGQQFSGTQPSFSPHPLWSQSYGQQSLQQPLWQQPPICPRHPVSSSAAQILPKAGPSAILFAKQKLNRL